MIDLPCLETGGVGRFQEWESRLLRAWYSPEETLPPTLSGMLDLGSRLYQFGLDRDQLRARRRQASLPVPVISVGNLVAGGTGKTPFVLWLAEFLFAMGWRPAIVSRGYGGSGRGAALVPGTGETAPLAAAFGDEPVLMARRATPVPVWVGRDRQRAGYRAVWESSAQSLILDDGFQHLRLRRDVDLVLLDACLPFGNGRLLPAGPLREPVDNLSRAHGFILTRAEDTAATQWTRSRLQRAFPGKPVFTCRHCLSGVTMGLDGAVLPLKALEGRQVVAFAGIAHPESFFLSLAEVGARLAACVAFPDHHRFGRSDMMRLLRKSHERRADLLITTAKDWVRLPSDVQAAVAAATLQLDFGSDETLLKAYLERRLSGKTRRPISKSKGAGSPLGTDGSRPEGDW